MSEQPSDQKPNPEAPKPNPEAPSKLPQPIKRLKKIRKGPRTVIFTGKTNCHILGFEKEVQAQQLIDSYIDVEVAEGGESDCYYDAKATFEHCFEATSKYDRLKAYYEVKREGC